MKIDIDYLSENLKVTRELVDVFFDEDEILENVSISLEYNILGNCLSISIPHYEYLIYESGRISYLSCSAPETIDKPFEIVLFLLKHMKQDIKICSYFKNETSYWGWKHAFTIDREIDILQNIDLIQAVINIK